MLTLNCLLAGLNFMKGHDSYLRLDLTQKECNKKITYTCILTCIKVQEQTGKFVQNTHSSIMSKFRLYTIHKFLIHGR